MSLMSMLDQAQGGRLFTVVARSVDLDEVQTRKAMTKLCPAIAERLHARAAEDEELFQSLLDLISDNGAASPLDDADSLTGIEAMSDGNAILDDVFGSRSAAMAAITIPSTAVSAWRPSIFLTPSITRDFPPSFFALDRPTPKPRHTNSPPAEKTYEKTPRLSGPCRH